MMKVFVSSIEELERLIMKLLNYGATTSLVLSHTVSRTEFNLDPPEAARPRASDLPQTS